MTKNDLAWHMSPSKLTKYYCHGIRRVLCKEINPKKEMKNSGRLKRLSLSQFLSCFALAPWTMCAWARTKKIRNVSCVAC